PIIRPALTRCAAGLYPAAHFFCVCHGVCQLLAWPSAQKRVAGVQTIGSAPPLPSALGPATGTHSRQACPHAAPHRSLIAPARLSPRSSLPASREPPPPSSTRPQP